MADPWEQAASDIAAQQKSAAPPISPTPALSADPFATAAKEIRDDQLREDATQAQLLNWRAANDSVDAGTRADVLRYSAASGLKPTFVEQNLPAVKQQVDAKGVNWALVAHRQPSLVKFLLETPDVQPLVKDDAANLGGIEWAIKAPFHAFLDALNEQRAVALQFKEGIGQGGEQNRQRIREIEAESANKDYGAGDSWLASGIVGAAKMLPFLAGDILSRVGGAAAGTALVGGEGAAAGGAASAPVGGEAAVPGAAVGGLAGAGVGEFMGSGLFNYYESVGPLYWRLRNLKDSSGQPLDHDTAQAFATAGAVMQAGIMAGFLGKIGGSLPGVKQLLQRFGAMTVEKALAEQTSAAALRSGFKSFGKHWLTGASLMAAQSGLGALAEEGAKAYSGQPFDVQWSNAAEAAARGFVSGARDMWLISAIGPGRETLKELGRARASAESAVRLQAIVDGAEGSKLRQLYSTGFEQAVAQMKADGELGNANVYVPAEQWTTYWSGKKVDPGEVAKQVLGDGGKAYAEAVTTKGDIAIPLEKYISKLAGTEHLKGLELDAKLKPDELTPRQYREEVKRQKDELARTMKARGDELKAGKQEVADFIREQAVAAGISKQEADANAKLVAETAATWAARLGVSVREAAAMSGLGRLRILGPRGEAVAEAARARFLRFTRPEASQLLGEQRVPSLSPEARANEYYLDRVSGLRNARLFARTPVPEGKQVAVITALAAKGLNDNPAGGHDVTNEMLRSVGASLGTEHPEAARGGTNFLFHVTDQAQLDAELAKLKAQPGHEHLDLVGAIGKDAEAAGKALDADVYRRRQVQEEDQPAPEPLRPGETALPKRGELNPALDVKGLKFKPGRAAGTVPADLVHEVGKLSDKEYAELAYLDTVKVNGEDVRTGLLTREGWDALPRKAHVASIDLRGLKAANKKYGKEFGNAMLAHFGRIAAHFGGSSFDLAHLSGDEYAAQHNDPAQLERFVGQLREALDAYTLDAVEGGTGKVERVSVQFRHGFGRSYGEADRDLNARKRAEAEVGAAAQLQGAGGVRRDGQLRGAEQEAAGAPRSSVPEGRGAQPQGFDEVVGYVEGVPVTFRGRRGGGEGGGSPDASFDFGDNAENLPAAQGYVERIKDPAKKAYAQAWLAYTRGAGERPSAEGLPAAIWREVERELLRHGFVDPEGASIDLEGRDRTPMAANRRGPNHKKGTTDPYAIRQRNAGVGLSGAAAELRDLRSVGKTTFNAGPADAPRGEIRVQLDPEGKPRAFDIRVLQGDRSTLAHETMHFLSFALHDIASSDLATPEVKADYETLLKFAGYASADERLAATREKAALEGKDQLTAEDERRIKELGAKEEKITHAWEQYLLEGKSPTEGLQRVFSRFKDWLLRIYKGVEGVQAQFRQEYGQELNLSDDVRRVFDRLLAQEDALNQAREETGAVPPPLITDAMTPAEREEYKNALTASRLASEREMAKRAVELQEKRIGPERERVRREVTQQIDSQPVYRAMRYLQRGELVDAEGVPIETPETMLDKDGQPYKLNRQSFVEKFTAAAARLMPPGVFARTKKGGVDIEQLAGLLGFDDGTALQKALTQAEPRERAIERQTQAKLDEMYGPALQELGAAAMRAVHNAESARPVLLELRAMAKELNPSVAARVRSIDLGTMRDAAARLVGETSVQDLDPDSYARAERQTAREVARLRRRGQTEAALEQAEARLWNHLLYTAARDAQEQIHKLHDDIEGVSQATLQALNRADHVYRDVHGQVLHAIGLGPLPEGELKTLDQLIQKANEDALDIAFDESLVRQLIKKPRDYSTLTVDEAHAVADAVVNIRHLARKVDELELAGKKQAKEAWFKDLDEKLSAQTPMPKEPIDSAARTRWQKAKHLGRGIDAELTDVPETYSHMLDGADRAGPVHRLLVDGRLAAREKELELTKGVLTRIEEAWRNIPKEVRKLVDKPVDVASLLPVPPGAEGRFEPVYTRSSLWMLFLNWGNEGNRQRIRDGHGWSDEQVTKALSLLSKPELDFLQNVLDTINSLWPDVAAVHEKRTGLQLQKVEAVPIHLGGEEYAGGYFPLKYRADLSRAGELQEGDFVKSIFAPNYYRPTTPKSHTKGRVEKVNAVVDLNWGVVPAHLSQVIHDLSYGEWVRQTASVMFDPRFKALTEEHLGRERAREFIPWLRDVANARADSASGAQSTFKEQLAGFARNRAAVAVMGMNLPSIMGQILDPWNAFQENVPARHIASAYVKVNSMLAGLTKLPELELSKELKYRDSMLKENLRKELGKMGPSGRGIGRAISETAFALYDVSDRYTSRVTWKAAWDHALSEGLSEEDAAQRADDVVRRAYASHDLAEKPPLMRSKRGIAALVMFYGFANRLYNSGRRSLFNFSEVWHDDDATTSDRVRAVANLGAKLMVLGATGAAFAYLAGRGPRKDQDPKKWLAWRMALEPFNTVPFLGSALSQLSEGKQADIRTAPELTLLADTLNRVGAFAQDAQKSGKKSDSERVINMVEALIGAAVGPMAQAHRTIDYTRQLATGQARPRRGLAGAADVASGLIYGKKENQGRNPLSDAGDFLHTQGL